MANRVNENVSQNTQRVLRSAFKFIPIMIDSFTSEVNELRHSERPDSLSIRFGVEITSEAQAIIATGGEDSNILITLTWENINDNINEKQ